jgi:uncharacterized protein YigE (DUF2233 family)
LGSSSSSKLSVLSSPASSMDSKSGLGVTREAFVRLGIEEGSFSFSRYERSSFFCFTVLYSLTGCITHIHTHTLPFM